MHSAKAQDTATTKQLCWHALSLHGLSRDGDGGDDDDDDDDSDDGDAFFLLKCRTPTQIE